MAFPNYIYNNQIALRQQYYQDLASEFRNQSMGSSCLTLYSPQREEIGFEPEFDIVGTLRAIKKNSLNL